MIELKWDLLAAKSLAAVSSKAACFTNPPIWVQEVGGEVQRLLFDKIRTHHITLSFFFMLATSML